MNTAKIISAGSIFNENASKSERTSSKHEITTAVQETVRDLWMETPRIRPCKSMNNWRQKTCHPEPCVAG